MLSNDIDLLNPPAELEKLKHKKKRLVQSPNSFFMVLRAALCVDEFSLHGKNLLTAEFCPCVQDVKCQGCFNMYELLLDPLTLSPLLIFLLLCYLLPPFDA